MNELLKDLSIYDLSYYLSIALGLIGFVFVALLKSRWGWVIWYLSSAFLIMWAINDKKYELAGLQYLYMILNTVVFWKENKPYANDPKRILLREVRKIERYMMRLERKIKKGIGSGKV